VSRRHAYVRQDDQSDCGAAALATVALHHGIPVGLQRMRDLAGTDRVGTHLLGLVRAAEGLGFSARAVKGSFEALPTVPLPAIAHVRTEEGLGHFVVLHRVGKGSVVVADPARGVETLSRAAFCDRWTGYLLLMVPEPKAPPGRPPVSPWRGFLGLLAIEYQDVWGTQLSRLRARGSGSQVRWGTPAPASAPEIPRASSRNHGR